MSADATGNTAEILMQALTQMEPFFEMAKGLRAKFEAEGWSPTVAEQLSAEWLIGIIRKAFG